MSQFDASIPVLTEVLRDDPPATPPAPAPTAQATAEAPPVAEPPTASRAEPAPGVWHYRTQDAAVPTSEPAAPEGESPSVAMEEPEPEVVEAFDWSRLEREVSERVLQQLNSRVDFVLEQRIKDSMSEVLSHALRDLTNEIRAGLHDTLGKIVTRAVQQEITHLQASAPKPHEKR
jgi:hypothetical protein